jgi:polar amino acid transport system substrate-binding protein
MKYFGMRTGRARALACGLLWAMGMAGPAGAQVSTPAPGAGFADPRGLAPRPAVVDIEPVYRAPAIDTLATVRKRGVLRVGVVNVEPMVMRSRSGELVGYSVDLARRLAQDIGVEVEFIPTAWSQVMPDLLGRQFDLVATGLWVTVPRALVVNFSQATAVEGLHLVAGKARSGSRSLEDFNQPGTVVAVYEGTGQAALAARLLPRATLLPVAEDPLTPVLQGRAQAALVPTLAPQALQRAAPGELFLPLARPLASVETAIAVRKGDPDFLAFINTWLALQRTSGWLDERLLHWSTTTDWLK